MKAFCLIAACFVAVAHCIYPPPPPPGSSIQKELPDIPEIQKRVSFRYYYVTHDGKAYNYKPSAPSIAIAATENVPNDAMRKAADIVSHMTKNSPKEVFSTLASFQGVGLFSAEEGLTVYPEHSRFADRPECYGRCDGACINTCMANGQKWRTMAGTTTTTRTVVLDDNVMCNAEDPYQHQENILSHEFSHLVELALPTSWHNKLQAAFRHAYEKRLWTVGTYAMQSAREYFGEATEAWFYATLRTDVTGGLNMCGTRSICKSEKAVRDHIRQHDPQLFEVLSYAYTNGRPELEGGMGACAKVSYVEEV